MKQLKMKDLRKLVTYNEVASVDLYTNDNGDIRNLTDEEYTLEGVDNLYDADNLYALKSVPPLDENLPENVDRYSNEMKKKYNIA
jgi:hypothetical protein